MKTNSWMVLGVMLSMGLSAQPVADPPPAAAPKSAPAKPADPTAAETPVVLVPGAATIMGDNVNVRGKASFVGEIIARLKKGDSVRVIEQVIREKAAAGEPSQWAKIGYPAGAKVWVHNSYIDAASKAVLPPRLNLRAGPGENYSVVGMIERGTTVKEVSVKGNWLEIEPPGDAYAFVAAQFLKQEGPAVTIPPVVSIAPPVAEPTVTTTPVAEPPVVAPPVTELPAAETPVAATTPPAEEPAGITPEPEPTDAPPPPAEEPLPPRIVSHQGIVRGTWSIQAPTKFALVSPDTGRTINYLYTTSTNLDLNRYKGLHIIVTGEEGLDERWRNTPVITIQRIQVIE